MIPPIYNSFANEPLDALSTRERQMGAYTAAGVNQLGLRRKIRKSYKELRQAKRELHVKKCFF